MKYEGQHPNNGHKERSEQSNENNDELIGSLRDLTGPEFIEKIKEIRRTNPGFISSLENSELKDRFSRDILEAVHFLEREGRDEQSIKSLEKYYYPEYLKGERRRNRRILGIYGGAFAVLGTGLAVSVHEINEHNREDQEEEKRWEAIKLSLPEQEIEQQIDTVFDGLKDNNYRHLAYDTLEQTIEAHLDKEEADWQNVGREKINNYIDSATTEDPKAFKNLTLEYWKQQNKLPSDYYQIAYTRGEIGTSLFEQKVQFGKEHDELSARRNDLLNRLRAAFLRTFDNKTADYVEESRKIEERTSKPEETKIETETTNENPELKKFTDHVHALLENTTALKDLDSALTEPSTAKLAIEIQDLENRLYAIRDASETEERATKHSIEEKRNEEIEALKAKGESIESSLDSLSESFTQEVWDYLKNYYLVHEVWEDYGLSDPDSKATLNKLQQDPKVVEALKKLTDAYKGSKESIDAEIQAITSRYEYEMSTAIKEIRNRTQAEITEIERTILSNRTKYDAFTKPAVNKYRQELERVWKEEREKLEDKSKIPEIAF